MMPIVAKLFIGALKKEKKKEKEKDNQYKLKKAMAIAIGLNKYICCNRYPSGPNSLKRVKIFLNLGFIFVNNLIILSKVI